MSYSLWGYKESDLTVGARARAHTHTHTHTRTDTLVNFISWNKFHVNTDIYQICHLVALSCPTLCDTVDCSPPHSSAHGISQARILEWVAIFSSRGTPQPRD